MNVVIRKRREVISLIEKRRAEKVVGEYTG
jgi:hypothetical protein